MSTASAVLRLRHKVKPYECFGTYVYCFGGIETIFFLFLSFFLLVPMSTASARGVTPHLMRGPVPALFRVFPGFRVVARNDGAVYCFDTACHPAHDAGSSYGTLSGISGFRVVARNDRVVYCFGGIETSDFYSCSPTLSSGTYVYCFGGIETCCCKFEIDSFVVPMSTASVEGGHPALDAGSKKGSQKMILLF